MYSDVSVASDGAGHTGRSDLNSSREAADTTLNGSLFQTLAVHGKKELGKVVLLIFSWKKLICPRGAAIARAQVCVGKYVYQVMLHSAEHAELRHLRSLKLLTTFCQITFMTSLN